MSFYYLDQLPRLRDDLEPKRKTVIIRAVSIASSSASTLCEEHEKPVVPEDGELADSRKTTDPTEVSALAKGRELLSFAGGCFRTYVTDLPSRHKAVSRQGAFAHYIVEPWYIWFGRNQRVTTSPALSTITLRPCDAGPERPLINGGSFNYVNTYGLSAEYEQLHRTCLDTLPIDGASASLIEKALEEEVAKFWGVDCCFTTPTGYQSSVLALTAILDNSWCILMDQKSHSSMTTAAYMANAGGRKKFRHNDMDDLERLLQQVEGDFANIMVAVEGLYSLDGDLPDLKTLHMLKSRYNFVFYCDEAHSFLSLGATGRGCLEWWNDTYLDSPVPADLIDIRVTTLSKAVGGVGGLVCATKRFANQLHDGAAESRTTGETLSTSAMLQAIWVLRQPERLKRSLSRLREMSSFCHQALLKAGLTVYGDPSVPILPIHAGRPTKASKLSYILRKYGVAATPFSTPAVPIWQSRVRIGLSAAFSDSQVDQLVDALVTSCDETKITQRGSQVKSQERRRRFRCPTTYTGLDREHENAMQSLHDLIRAQKTQSIGVQPVRTQSQPIIAAGHKARAQYGLSSGSSRWILGTYPTHLDVEQQVCAITAQPTAMLYSNTEVGLMSTVAALCRPIKGCRQHWLLLPSSAQRAVRDGYRIAPPSSGTTRVDYTDQLDLVHTLRTLVKPRRKAGYLTLVLSAHHDLSALAECLAKFRPSFHGATILLDSTFVLPSQELARVAGELDARALVFSSFYHTLGGLNSAFLAGDKVLIEELRYTSRCYVFTAAPAPYMMGMVAEGLRRGVGQ